MHPSVPANSVKELIALAKSKPGTLHFAHAGVGSFTHTASVLFAMMAGIEIVHDPVQGRRAGDDRRASAATPNC